MIEVPINYWAVIVAAILNMVLGYIWFGPLFGKLWVRLDGMAPRDADAAKQKGMWKSYALMFVGSLLMAYVLAHSLIFASAYMNASGISAGLTVGLWSWIGFVAPVTIGVVLWNGKSWKYWAVTYLYYLVALLLMGVILAMWI